MQVLVTTVHYIITVLLQSFFLHTIISIVFFQHENMACLNDINMKVTKRGMHFTTVLNYWIRLPCEPLFFCK